MKYLKPKNNRKGKVDWEISERTRAIIKYYAQYSEYTEEEVVDLFLKNLLDDKSFQDWIKKLRNNKRMLEQMMEEQTVG